MKNICLFRLGWFRTVPFHGINVGSNPARDIFYMKLSLIAQLVERIAVNYMVIGSSPIQRVFFVKSFLDKVFSRINSCWFKSN